MADDEDETGEGAVEGVEGEDDVEVDDAVIHNGGCGLVCCCVGVKEMGIDSGREKDEVRINPVDEEDKKEEEGIAIVVGASEKTMEESPGGCDGKEECVGGMVVVVVIFVVVVVATVAADPVACVALLLPSRCA